VYFISIKGIEQKDSKSLGFISGMSVFYDSRLKRYEFRGTKQKHKKFIKLFEEFAKIHKAEIHEWDSNVKYSENIYTKIK